MTRRVVKYQRLTMLRPRFSVDEKRRRLWFEPVRWRSIATFDTLTEAVAHLRVVEDDERKRDDADIGETLQVLFESDGATWVKP